MSQMHNISIITDDGLPLYVSSVSVHTQISRTLTYTRNTKHLKGFMLTR